MNLTDKYKKMELTAFEYITEISKSYISEKFNNIIDDATERMETCSFEQSEAFLEEAITQILSSEVTSFKRKNIAGGVINYN